MSHGVVCVNYCDLIGYRALILALRWRKSAWRKRKPCICRTASPIAVLNLMSWPWAIYWCLFSVAYRSFRPAYLCFYYAWISIRAPSIVLCASIISYLSRCYYFYPNRPNTFDYDYNQAIIRHWSDTLMSVLTNYTYLLFLSLCCCTWDSIWYFSSILPVYTIE